MYVLRIFRVRNWTVVWFRYELVTWDFSSHFNLLHGCVYFDVVFMRCRSKKHFHWHCNACANANASIVIITCFVCCTYSHINILQCVCIVKSKSNNQNNITIGCTSTRNTWKSIVFRLVFLSILLLVFTLFCRLLFCSYSHPFLGALLLDASFTRKKRRAILWCLHMCEMNKSHVIIFTDGLNELDYRLLRELCESGSNTAAATAPPNVEYTHGPQQRR